MTPGWDGESYCTECVDELRPALFEVPCGMVDNTPVVDLRCAFHAEGFDVGTAS